MQEATAHHHLAALARVANHPGLTPQEVALLHAFARAIWAAYRAWPGTVWEWSFHCRAGVHTDAEGWDACAALAAFARIDPTIRTGGPLEPGFHGFRTPQLTQTAVRAVSGVQAYGIWHNPKGVMGACFRFELPL